MFGSEFFDDPTAAPRLDDAGGTHDRGDDGGTGDRNSSADDHDSPAGVFAPTPPPHDIMTFTDVAVDAASQARIRQIAGRIEELGAAGNLTVQEQTEVTELFGELARLTGMPAGEPPGEGGAGRAPAAGGASDADRASATDGASAADGPAL